MKLLFTETGWSDYLYWVENDTAILAKLNAVIADCRRRLFTGIGKPEPLKGDLSGWWSRRTTGEHRLIYRIEGKPGVDQRIVISSCRYHYAE